MNTFIHIILILLALTPTYVHILVVVRFLDQSELACLQRIGHPPSAPAMSKVKGRKMP